MNAAGFLLFCWYAARCMKKSRIPWPLETQIIAHRGLTSVHLENSKNALLDAVSYGADGVEFDIQLTRDAIPVIFHDRKLTRLSTINDAIDNLSALEVSRLLQHSPRYKEGYSIATFEELLRAMPKNKILNIELKETTCLKGSFGIKKILNILRPFKNEHRIIISSFDPKILTLVAQENEDYDLGFLIDTHAKPQTIVKALKILPMISYLHPHLNLVPRIPNMIIKKLGLSLIVWGHKKMGTEKITMEQGHCALISDIPQSLIKKYKNI